LSTRDEIHKEKKLAKNLELNNDKVENMNDSNLEKEVSMLRVVVAHLLVENIKMYQHLANISSNFEVNTSLLRDVAKVNLSFSQALEENFPDILDILNGREDG